MNEPIELAVETLLKTGELTLAPTRRAFPRYSVAYPIHVELDEPEGETTRGVTINMCRSGMLVRFEGSIAAGTSCRITFEPGDAYRPELVECPHCASKFPIVELPDEPVRGIVVRVERQDETGTVAAIMFESPLAAATGEDS